MNNIQAFIDGQNLHQSLKHNGLFLNAKRFMFFLQEEYGVKKAYYFLGVRDDANEELYENLREAGFFLVFRCHNSSMSSYKKGNVDGSIIFKIMSKLYYGEDFQAVIVSNDGDYFELAHFLASERKLFRILAPTHYNLSSLYNKYLPNYVEYLDEQYIVEKRWSNNKQ